jgi:hypothetical protein
VAQVGAGEIGAAENRMPKIRASQIKSIIMLGAPCRDCVLATPDDPDVLFARHALPPRMERASWSATDARAS